GLLAEGRRRCPEHVTGLKPSHRVITGTSGGLDSCFVGRKEICRRCWCGSEPNPTLT
ncbi:unnamed protein product, partial [Ectocarpus sp. 8 AP-2014]